MPNPVYAKKAAVIATFFVRDRILPVRFPGNLRTFSFTLFFFPWVIYGAIFPELIQIPILSKYLWLFFRKRYKLAVQQIWRKRWIIEKDMKRG